MLFSFLLYSRSDGDGEGNEEADIYQVLIIMALSGVIII